MKLELVFHDDFMYEGLPSKDYWVMETGGHGFGNNEDQFYTDRLDNVFVKNGILHIKAMKEKYENRNYTSAKLTTYGINSIKYGRVEIKAKLPAGKGTWPAFWMLPDSIRNGVKWPLCGEIDIMEHIGRDQDMVHFSLHTESYNFKDDSQFTKFLTIPGVTENFHTYSMEWDEEGIKFFVDDLLLANFRKGDREDIEETGWPFDQKFYLVLNLAVGGYWGGAIDEDSFPWAMEIEDVKVYKKLE